MGRHLSAVFVCLAAGMALAAVAAAQNAPLPPTYPAKRSVPAYAPDRFVANADAAVALPGGGSVRERDFTATVSLAGEWKLSPLAGSKTPFPAAADLDQGYERPGFDDAAWETIPVPLNWYKKHPEFYGTTQEKPYIKGWYRKRIDVPASAAGQRVVLHFDVVGYEARLFVNGREAGAHHGDFTPWEVDVTPFVTPGKPAVVALRVFSDFAYEGQAPTVKHVYGSAWATHNIKGGLWQEARLRIEPAVRITEALVTPELASSSIRVDCSVRNDTALARTVGICAAAVPAERALAAGAPVPPASRVRDVVLQPGMNRLNFRLPLDQPRLWTPDTPNLYHLVLPVVADGRAVSVKTVRFGFRTFKADGDRFLLNGKYVYLFGENCPSVSFGGNPEGPEAERAALAKYLLGFNALGYNIVRCPHMPIIPVAFEIADEIGLMFYDEWGWAFQDKPDPSFERTNLQELAEWVVRDYNHPSVVMWCCGNEIQYGTNPVVREQLDKQVALLRSLDKSGRPISSFSGGAYGYGTQRLDTDVLDLHCYMGLTDNVWTFWENNMNHIFRLIFPVYGRPGALGKPFIIWECVGYSWGSATDPNFIRDDIDEYLKWTAKDSSWGNPNGIAYAGSLGLAASLDPERSSGYGQEQIGRRVLELVRQDPRISGFAPWFQNASLRAATLWNQPVFCGLRGGSGEANVVPLRNLFAGRETIQQLFVVNSMPGRLAGGTLKFSLAEADGSETSLGEQAIPAIAPGTVFSRNVSLMSPRSERARWAQLRLRLLADGRELSSNFYDVFIQPPAILTAAIGPVKRVGLLNAGSDGGRAVARILQALAIPFAKIDAPEQVAACQAIILPPAATEPTALTGNSPLAAALGTWNRNGGDLIVLEQGWAGDFPLISRSFTKVAVALADVINTQHPLFTGLSQANFEFWSSPEFGLTSQVVASPFTDNALVARAPLLGQQATYAVVAEGKLGGGRILSSQLEAVSRWGRDSAASVYLRNLLTYTLVADAVPAAGLRTWSEQANRFAISKDAAFVGIDLRPVANVGFRDDVAADGRGGWTDQGDNDFRAMPLGRQVFRNVPFDIIDPAHNGGKSCVALRNPAQAPFPARVQGIKVGERLRRLFFLHTDAWGKADKRSVLKYTVNYADGRSTVIDVLDGVNICDWWSFANLPGAKLAFSCANASGHQIGLGIMEWDDPRGGEVPIATLDAEATDSPLPIVVAITGERISPFSVVLQEAAAGAAGWGACADASANVLTTGPAVPVVEAAVDQADFGPGTAIRIRMPAKAADGPIPAAFKAFPEPEWRKLASVPRQESSGAINFAPPGTVSAKKPQGGYSYLVIEAKAAADSAVVLVLPDRSWKDALRHTLQLRAADGWRTYRLSLDKDFGLNTKAWGLDQLRGEFFIYNGTMGTLSPAADFLIRSIRLE